jgi:subtilisin family serine protease
VESNGERFTNIANNLKGWLATGEVPDDIRTVGGAIEVLVTADFEVDLVKLGQYMRIISVFDLPGGLVIQGTVQTAKALQIISEFDEIGVITGNQFNKVLDGRSIGPGTDSFVAREIMGVTDVEAEFPGYNGSGVVIGIVDTGVDFGVTDLADAIALDAAGKPLSFDPGGAGIAITTFALPSVGGYLLTEGLDFRMYRDDSGLFWSNSTYGIYAENMKVGGYGGLVSASGIYRVGMSVQTASGLPAGRAFFVFVLTDSVTPFVYDTVHVDFETSWALTADYNGISTGVAADWDFTNNDPHMFDNNPVLAADFDDDGVNDWSMGSLSNTFDLMGKINGDMVYGIDPNGRGFAFMFDNIGHGTACAGAAAGRGIVEYDVYGNGTTYALPGIAPGAEIMALKTFTIADNLWTWFWGCGYRPIVYDYYWFDYWDYVGTDAADILSNSWGYDTFSFTGYDMPWSYDYISQAMEYLTWASDTLFCVSTGNTGPGYGTASAPVSAQALMVGASSTAHIWQTLYGNYTQGYDTLADFSSSGPTPQGFGTPSVVAVGAYAFDITPLQEAGGDGLEGYQIFGGTSQACPYAAGVAAIVQGANPALTADEVKAIVMNGADDLGYDVYRQGAGRVNAYRSIHMAFGNATDGTHELVTINSYETWQKQYYGAWRMSSTQAIERQDAWRSWRMNMYGGGPNGINNFWLTSQYHPGATGSGAALMDGAVFPYPIYRGNSYSFDVSAYAGSGPADGIESLTGYTYALLNASSEIMTTHSTYTSFNLTKEFDSSFMTQFYTADFAAIHLTYPLSNFEAVYGLSGMANYVFLHDWMNDTNDNGFIDLTSLYVAGEVRRISSDTTYSNCHQINVGFPGSHFIGDPTLYYHDVGLEFFLWRSLNVNVTIRLYERVPWTWITTNQVDWDAWNVTVAVPADAVPGFYEGYLQAINGTGVTRMPVSVRVDAAMAEAGVAGEVSWGGSQGTPYDNGATNGNVQWGYREHNGDYRFYFVDAYNEAYIPSQTTPYYVMVNVSWTDPDTRLDVIIYHSNYGYVFVESDSAWSDSSLRYEGSSTWSKQNVLFYDSFGSGLGNNTWLSRGLVGIAVRTAAFGGTMGAPEDFYVTVTYTDSLPDAPAVWMNVTLPLSYGGQAIKNDTPYTGPHVTFKANWSQLVAPDFPALQIRQTRMELLSISEQTHYGDLTENRLAGWNPDLNPREGYDYVELRAGQTVAVTVEFGSWVDPSDPTKGLTHTTADDVDVMVWAPGATHVYSLSLTGSASASSHNPEVGTFVAPVDGNYTIGLDYYSGVWPMAWQCYVRAFSGAGATTDGLAGEVDTSLTNLNDRYDVRAIFITGTSLDADLDFCSQTVPRVTVTNFFAPTLAVTAPNGGEEYEWEKTVNITWTASDQNLDEDLQFSVEVSNDSGANWQVIVYGTPLFQATWNPSSTFYGLPPSTQCLVRVNVTDGMFTVSDTSNSVFTTKAKEEVPPLPLELITVVIVAVLVIVILLVTCLLKRRQTAAK